MPHPVGVNREGRLCDLGGEADGACRVLHTERIGAAVKKLEPADRLLVDLQPVGLDAGDVEQLRDQPHHAVDFAEDRVEVRHALFGRQIVDRLREQLRVALDGRQRRAQLVRGDGEKLVLLAVELLQRRDVANHEDRADDAVALDRRRRDRKVEVFARDEVPAHGQVVGDRHAAEGAGMRKVVRRNGPAIGIAKVELRERPVLGRLGARAEAEHRDGRFVDGDDLPTGVVNPESVRHRAENRVESRRAFGHRLRQVFDLAPRVHLVGDVLDQHGQVLRDTGESSADGRNDPVDVRWRRPRLGFERLIETHLARLGDLLERLLQ